MTAVYQTKGKRYTFEDGTTIYEGEYNRAIKARAIEQLTAKGIPFYDLVPEQKDIHRSTRISRADYLYKKSKGRTFLIDLHSNAGGGKGCETWLCHGASSKSRVLASWTKALFYKHFPESKFRGIKYKNWDILALTRNPAIILELFFMDNEQECKKYLLTSEGRDRAAAYVVDIIEKFIKYHS
ncbi:N-acetylmuramoyl-L-alanine amidase [Aureispira anguillae]|uniref:N-acetylmuramoyl-L-alanine amidase n=1 Tax=Aureispira anguillae TaxID=2864201 RepID=A0A916DSW1_9BACT|nr:N-acetylmuramoyl-L-alanine amidase [Aureispira anguillae]BDS12789.1 N-acetylmuramoyl-L-alanine amidase [Aureispira anguillae]